MNKEKNFISAIVYVYNNEKEIYNFLQNLINCLKNNFLHYEIICVNDCSTDNSVQEIKKISSKNKDTTINIINMSFYQGKEFAINAGVDLSIGDFVYEFDSTYMDYDKEEIMNIYRKSQEGYDIVSTSPDKSRKSSNLFYYVFDKFADISCKMSTERFRILSRRVINRISSMNKSIPYRKVMYSNCGLKTENKVYEVKDINRISDKLEQKYRKGLAIESLILFTNVGYRFSIGMTMLMMVMTIFMSVYSIATYVVSTPVEGWTTTILFLSIAFFGLFGILTIIIKYLQMIIDLVFKRKQYSFESIEKLTK